MSEFKTGDYWKGANDARKQMRHESQGHDRRTASRPWSLFETPCHYKPPREGKTDYLKGWRKTYR